jgi:hypothetical protein
MNSDRLAAAPILAFLLLVVGLIPFHAYTGLPRKNAFLALLASCVAAGFQVYSRMRSQRTMFANQPETILPALAAGACIVLTTALVLRLWGRWIGDRATPAECQPGKAGVHAWFSAGNVSVGVAIVVFAWYGFDVSPILTAVLLTAVFAAYPVIRMDAPATAPTAPRVVPAPPSDGHSLEREKIVSMLEAGKLTPDESAELLQALSEKPQAALRQVPLTGGQRFMLIGAALVALGFFLPWLVVNPGEERGHMMNQLESSVNSAMPETFRNSMNMSGGFTMPKMEMNLGSVTYSGGDVGRGLGWAALGLAIAAAVLPYVGTSLDARTIRTVRFLCLGLGALIVLYILTQNLRYVGVGLVIVFSGYVLEILGVLRERESSVA